MTDPTPTPPAPVIDYAAKLSERRPMHERPEPNSWLVTFGLGKPAAGMYSEVRFADDAYASAVLAAEGHGTAALVYLDEVTRRVAADLYGTAYAFTYRPEQYATAIERYSMRLREVVEVSSIEVYL